MRINTSLIKLIAILAVAQSTFTLTYTFSLKVKKYKNEATREVESWYFGRSANPYWTLNKYYHSWFELPENPATGCVWFTKWDGTRYAIVGDNGHENCVDPPEPEKKENVITYASNGCHSDLGEHDPLPYGEQCKSGQELLAAVNKFRADPIHLARWIQSNQCRLGGSDSDNEYNEFMEYDETINYLIGLNNDEYYIMNQITPTKNYMDATHYTANLCQMHGFISHYHADETGKSSTPAGRLLKFSGGTESTHYQSENIGGGGCSKARSCNFFLQLYLVDRNYPGKGHRVSLTNKNYKQGGAGLSNDLRYNVIQFGEGYKPKEE